MIPDYCEAITAYRVWSVAPNGLLIGQAHSEPWPTYQPFVGRCGAVASKEGALAHVGPTGDWRAAPVYQCDCGVHALKSREMAEQRWREFVAPDQNGFFSFSWGSRYEPRQHAWGAVKLWGRLIEHADGYRAEFAYPSEVFCADKALATKIAALYGVPCAVVEKPKAPTREDDDDYGVLTYGGLSNVYKTFYTSGLSGYGAPVWTPVTAPQATPPPPSILAQPTLTQITTLGASPWQKRQAMAGARHGGKTDWQAVMKRAFHATKKADDMSIVIDMEFA